MSSKEFENAKLRLNNLKEDPGNDVKLKIYALFKQATVGSCNTPKPDMMDFVGKAKWNAWSELGNLSKIDAEKEYIKLVNRLMNINDVKNNEEKKYNSILTNIEFGNVFKIILNRPTKKNAFNRDMYSEVKSALEEANSNDNILFVCITGAGDYFTSGNDLNNYSETNGFESIEDLTKQATKRFQEFIDTFIDFKKPIIGLVNGPAVGVGVTFLGLFDLVYASDKATFHTPFTKLALIPEACSSYTFPLLMGDLRANEVLLFNRKLTAFEAYERGLVNQVFQHDKFNDEVFKKLEEFSKLPKGSLYSSRYLLRMKNIDVLKKVNKLEVEYLAGQIGSEDFMNALTGFMQSKSKL